MPGGARSWAVALSLGAHAVVGAAIGKVSRPEPPPAVFELVIDIPEEEPRKADPEPVQEKQPETAPAAKAAPAEEPRQPRPAPDQPVQDEPASSSAQPLATGVEMENPAPGGDGPALGPAARRPAPARPPPAAARPPTAPAHDAPPAGAPCSEPASKPKPASRPRDIDYLDDARAREVEGRLVLAVTVAPDGSVSAVEVTSPVDPALDAAAVEAVKTWHFEPARRCGKPVEGTFTLARRFVLGD